MSTSHGEHDAADGGAGGLAGPGVAHLLQRHHLVGHGEPAGRRVFGHTGATGTLVWMDPDADGFCVLLTSALRAAAPWRLVHLSNAVAAAFV